MSTIQHTTPQLIEQDDHTDVEADVPNPVDNNFNSEVLLELKKLIDTHGVANVEEMIHFLRLSEDEKKDPVLWQKEQQLTVFPINYPVIWNKHYKKQESAMWTAEEIDMSNDYNDFLTLDENSQEFILNTLAFFAASDGIVNFNISKRFKQEIHIHEAQITYDFQQMMENIHSETYSLMLDTIVKDPVKKDHYLNAIKTVPAVKVMADWAFKWIDSSESVGHRLIAFAIVEGVFFSGAFAAIFWLKKYCNKGATFMNGLVQSNGFIARDEKAHTAFACELYGLLQTKLSEEVVHEMMRDGVSAAKTFANDSLKVKLLGMNAEDMSSYLEFVGDTLLSQLGYPVLFNTANPFKFMETIGMTGKANFFEKRPGEYSNPHLSTTKNTEKVDFAKLDVDNMDF